MTLLMKILVLVKLVWMKLYYWFFDNNALREDSEVIRSVLCIGDGFIEGFGDKFAIGLSSGLCNRMNHLFKQERKLRMEWQFINGGQYGSTTEDWLPIEAYSNYCRIVERYPQVQVVFIMLGSSDRLYV